MKRSPAKNRLCWSRLSPAWQLPYRALNLRPGVHILVAISLSCAGHRLSTKAFALSRFGSLFAAANGARRSAELMRTALAEIFTTTFTISARLITRLRGGGRRRDPRFARNPEPLRR